VAAMSPAPRWINVIAPAGYGKTTLMASIGEQRKETERVCWLTLTQGDTLHDLATGILSACRAAFPLLRSAIQDAAHTSIIEQSVPQRMAVMLADEIAEFVHEPILLVIDDLHRLEDPAAEAMLADLLELLPEQVRVMTGSRIKLNLPYARWHSRGDILDFDLRDLQLTEDETADFLRESLNLEVSDEQVARILERTGGWTAGLNLLHSASGGGIDTALEAKLPTWLEYLETEVLGQMSDEDRWLMVRCAMLEILDPIACSRVLDKEVNSAQLKRIHSQNRFVEALDPIQNSYRIHDIFRDFLQTRLQALPLTEIAELFSRAADASDNPLIAARMLVNANLYDLALARLRKDVVGIQSEANISSLQHILESIPQEQCSDSGILHFLLGFCHTERWRFAEARHELELAVSIMEKTDDLAIGYAKARLVSIGWTFSDLTTVWKNTEEALASDVDETARMSLYCTRAWLRGLNGDYDGAGEDAAIALDMALASGNAALLYELVAAFNGPIFRIPRVAQRLEEILPILQSAIRGRETPQRAHVHLLECYLQMCKGNWEGAIEFGEKALAISDRFGGLHNIIVDICRMIPMCYVHLGQLEGAEQCLARGKEVINSKHRATHPRPWLDLYTLHLVRVALAKKNILKAKAYSKEATGSLESRWPTAEWFRVTGKAYIAMAEGRMDRAQAYFQTSADLLEKWPNLVVVADPNLALAYFKLQKGEYEEARKMAEVAIKREYENARPGLLFMTGREILEPLLEIVDIPEATPVKILAASLPTAEHRVVIIPGTEEKLTPREIEVLELVAAGASNTEIAERLVISPFTVKRHVTHLLTKLGVNSRTKAAKIASEILHT